MDVMTSEAVRAVAPRRNRGPGDPDRRGRIADAAIAVAMQEGLDAVTHRRVAAEAGVPLGSTTYYFRTIDDLLSVAMEKAAQRSLAYVRRWEEGLDPDVDLPSALADYVLDSLGEGRDSTVLEYNLYAMANLRPPLRKAALDWDRGLMEVLSKRTDVITGKMLSVTLCGLLLQLVLSDDLPSHGEIRELFKRALAVSAD